MHPPGDLRAGEAAARLFVSGFQRWEEYARTLFSMDHISGCARRLSARASISRKPGSVVAAPKLLTLSDPVATPQHRLRGRSNPCNNPYSRPDRNASPAPVASTAIVSGG